MTVLGSGRTSRLHQRLVEELRLCARVSADVTESVAPGVSVIAAEAMSGADPKVIEGEVLEVLRCARAEPPSTQELERARSQLVSDWVFSHERIHQRSILAATAETLFDAEYPARYIRCVRECASEEIVRVAQDHLSPEAGSVVGWSLPGAVE